MICSCWVDAGVYLRVWSGGRHPTHAAVNNIILRALTPARIPSCLEPAELYIQGWKKVTWWVLYHTMVLRKALVWDSDIIVQTHMLLNICPRQPERLVQQSLRCSSWNTPHITFDPSHHLQLCSKDVWCAWLQHRHQTTGKPCSTEHTCNELKHGSEWEPGGSYGIPAPIMVIMCGIKGSYNGHIIFVSKLYASWCNL